MTNSNRNQVALIIRQIKYHPKYLEESFFYQNALNTFRVLNKIATIDRRLITGGLLARATKYLISLEIEPGGPYSEDKTKPDPELNREIALFLGLQGVVLPALGPFTKKVKLHRDNYKIFQHLRRLAEASLSPLPKSFQSIIKPHLEKVIASDKDQQILLLSYFFKLSLGNCGARIDPKTIYELGLANLFLWLSYSLYDDLIDGDESLDLLPIANWAAREFASRFSQQPSSPEYQLLFRKITGQMDYSQIWEMKYARFDSHQADVITAPIKHYQRPKTLYNKSLAHCLGPMLLLDQLKQRPSSTSGKNILSFFKYYLSLRQLQDDIHDYLVDYQAGIITSANIRMIKNQIKPDQIQNYFVSRELPRLNKITLKYQKAAESHLRLAPIIRYPDYLLKLLNSLTTNPAEIKEFLNTYQSLDH
ncbi:hypothetical protein COT98_01275 [Candidatus Falkowbacteria bacterium CG10_big_fil_rev_8_21_14_0_10_39_9]|uniref:Uncharacterized protein n=1 Tax=Candidatus Falkowbacteria bacterium CG10_big_fil_rev_8_21_14_0_10_39_9 TaxID=1974566 RepID=A0A2M6WQH1_9BACT|nr:MAG: hypothetical protein COT98_01275 [Candidatus Falkowbacteria bacterium CG10_big_fil_rev_8_21_14_0_10_39_9]